MKSFRLRSAIEATSSAKRWAKVRSQSSVLLISSCRLFWETISDEHNINRSKHFFGTNISPFQRLNVNYEKSCARSTCHVRTYWISSLQPNRCSCIGQLFNPASCSQLGSRSLPGGAELIDSVLDFTHYKVENCDCLKGFQTVHSIGGSSASHGSKSMQASRIRRQWKMQFLFKLSNKLFAKMTSLWTVHSPPQTSSTFRRTMNAKSAFVHLSNLLSKHGSGWNDNGYRHTLTGCCSK